MCDGFRVQISHCRWIVPREVKRPEGSRNCEVSFEVTFLITAGEHKSCGVAVSCPTGSEPQYRGTVTQVTWPTRATPGCCKLYLGGVTLFTFFQAFARALPFFLIKSL
eukprot:s224_g17.t1